MDLNDEERVGAALEVAGAALAGVDIGCGPIWADTLKTLQGLEPEVRQPPVLK